MHSCVDPNEVRRPASLSHGMEIHLDEALSHSVEQCRGGQVHGLGIVGLGLPRLGEPSFEQLDRILFPSDGHH